MSSLTTNLKLVKPELQDNITPTIFADNFDKIDAALEGVSGGALSLEEIEASTNLDGKIPSAAALKEVNNRLQNINLNKELDYANKISLLSYNSSNKYYTVPKCGIVIIENNFTQSGQRVILYDKKYSTTEHIAFCDGNGINTGTVSIEVYKGQELYIETSPQGAKRFDFTPFK